MNHGYWVVEFTIGKGGHKIPVGRCTHKHKTKMSAARCLGAYHGQRTGKLRWIQLRQCRVCGQMNVVPPRRSYCEDHAPERQDPGAQNWAKMSARFYVYKMRRRLLRNGPPRLRRQILKLLGSDEAFGGR